ncbi:MAG TPA: 16S rRNA (guanine(527)-N(7))-methyltransferase RsmG [Acetobacteraceae bacterium]|nr:16S rRNA (guanine(527)-N(7))-methyltransferase RsmG [Acetobacteraceae bacterium]
MRRFAELLLRWNASLNLIGRGELRHLWTRHIADSLQLGRIGALPARAIDLGSGAGFPGLILAIAYGIHVDLVEQDQRKAAFLREAARVTQAPVTVHAMDIARVALPPAPLVTARALAPVAKLLEYAQPLLTPDGACLFLKGRDADAELAQAAAGWQMQVEKFSSETDANGVILRISQLRRR